MRSPLMIFGFCLILAGCALETERQSLGYGDYVALSCDRLGQETVNLMRAAADRSHHLTCRRSSKARHREAAAWSGQTGLCREAVLGSSVSSNKNGPAWKRSRAVGTRSLDRGRRDNDATTNRCHDPAVEITAAVISEPYSPLVVVRVAARKTWRRGSDESFRRACLLASIRDFTLSASK